MPCSKRRSKATPVAAPAAKSEGPAVTVESAKAARTTAVKAAPTAKKTAAARKAPTEAPVVKDVPQKVPLGGRRNESRHDRPQARA